MDKKKNVLARIAMALGLLAAMATPLAGCSAEDASPKNVVFVLCNTQGNKAADQDVVSHYLDEVCETHGTAAAIVCDGDPYVALEATEIGSNDSSEKSRRLANDATVASLSSQMVSCAAESAEVDILKGIDMAARISSSMPEGDTEIAVFSNGLQTTGLLQWQEGLLNADPHEVADYYECELPDLSGVSVTWHNLGETSEPQKAPSIAQRESIQAVWEAVLSECGATVSFEEGVADGSVEGDLPSVTCIDMPEPVRFSLADEEIVLPGNEVFGFEPDSAVLLDEAAAREAVECLVAKNPGIRQLKLNVVGHTATVSTLEADIAACDELGLQRAERIASLFVEAGVPENNITISSRGSRDNVAERYDLDSAGRQIPAKAQANRFVSVSFEE